MISSLTNSLTRVTIFWYVVGLLVLFLGHPDWAESGYLRLAQLFPWVPELELEGLSSAANIQWQLLTYWSVPVLGVWLVAILLGAAISEIRCQVAMKGQLKNLKPDGEFGGVTVASYSLGQLPQATTPRAVGSRIALSKSDAKRGEGFVNFKGAVADAVKMLTPGERLLCEQLIQLLTEHPDHYAGLGHGVSLLEHTLNVASQAAPKCTPEFRLPLLGALAHDIGKLVTFQPDGNGGWKRRGLHSRESARILVTLTGFRELPELHQDALLLAVKYDHAPNKMPDLRGNREASMLALRIINALSQADRAATAEEKDRHLERLQPEDLLWKDFVDFLREAPIATRGKKGTANMLNNPPDSAHLFIYEAAWRDAAVKRLPPEVAAALDLTRRDPGKLAKYTRILVERLRKEGLLLDGHGEMSVTELNPLWDIQSGTGEKSVVFRGVLALKAEPLWTKLNYRLSVKSPFPVTILAPNADADGRVNTAPKADTSAGGGVPEVNDGLKLDITSASAMADIGLALAPAPGAAGDAPPPVARNPKSRPRATSRAEAPDPAQDSIFGLTAAPAKPVPLRAAPAAGQEAGPTPANTPPAPADSLPTPSDVNSASDEPAPAETKPAASAPDAQAPQAPPAALVPGLDPAPAHAPTAPKSAPTPAAPELSRAERKAGLAIADAEAVTKYPQLKVGDKYYTEAAPAVSQGTIPAGRKYKENNAVSLSESGPRRNVRRYS